MRKVIKYVMLDILRNKIILGYTVLLFLISFSVFSFEDNIAKGLLSLLNLELFIIPLVSIVFSTIYIYNSSEFIELLVSQPLKRKDIWMSFFWGLSGSLTIAICIGSGIPLLYFQQDMTGLVMLIIGCFLSVIFVSIALLAVLITRDKAKGIGISMFLWLYFAIIFDGLILYILFQFADYPLEKTMMILSFFNPIDLCRIVILLRLDISALMGYTGAVFKDFFGTATGMITSVSILLLWIIIPIMLSRRIFKKKDL